MFEEFADEGVGLARGGAVADGDGTDVVPGDEVFQDARGAGEIVLRLVGIDDVVAEEFTGFIDDGDLAAGADAGIEREDGDLSGGWGEQEVFEIFAEDFNGLEVGLLLEFEADFGLDGEVEEALV